MTRIPASRFRHMIEEHFDTADLDVVCRKKGNAYAVYWADDDQPLAKLRPTGRDDEVEIYHWDDSRWNRIDEFGLVLPLEESVEYITDDPDNLFFDADDQTGIALPQAMAAAVTRALCRRLFLCAVFGGAVGGAFSGAGSGGMWGFLVGMLACAGRVSIRSRLRTVFPYAIIVGMPVSLVAGAGGALGGSVNGLVSHAVLGSICGVLIGGLSSLLTFGGRWVARGIGFLAGLTLAASFVEMLGWRDQFVGLTLVAVAASLSASLFAFFSGPTVREGGNANPIVTCR